MSVDRRWSLAAALDIGMVSLFVAIGRRNHDEESGLAGYFGTAFPFLLALVFGWLCLRAWRRPVDVGTGLALWPFVVIGGMVFRRIAGDGTAASFVIVATVFLGITLVGWRALHQGVIFVRTPSAHRSRLRRVRGRAQQSSRARSSSR